MPTDPSRKFELLFRLYGPQKPLFDHSMEAAGRREIRGTVSGERSHGTLPRFDPGMPPVSGNRLRTTGGGAIVAAFPRLDQSHAARS